MGLIEMDRWTGQMDGLQDGLKIRTDGREEKNG